MKVILGILAALVFLTIGSPAVASSQSTVLDLARALDDARDPCAQQAQRAAQDASTANFKASLDLKTAQMQAEMDARVYGVGHGRRETREFLLDRMHGNSVAATKEMQRISDGLGAINLDVQVCLAVARTKGKAEYSAFKADKRHKSDMPEADSLMTAWLTNIGEIDIDHPQGGESSLAAWKSARAHAELSAL